ncbi:MAG: 16S rRNA (guanine(966)-N(2))-methyltransferase RsmD [Demequina sp.]
MTRIIAGALGGRRISVPPKGTRPTTDRVREALFSRLDHAGVLRGSRMLDLYAGSGAFGLEALSRGAAHATFVESAAPALRVIQTNIRELGVGTRADTVRERVQHYLERGTILEPFDVVFLDPPYDISRGDMAAALAALVPHLADQAAVVVEWSTHAPTPEWPRGLESTASKDYGETVLHYAKHVG